MRPLPLSPSSKGACPGEEGFCCTLKCLLTMQWARDWTPSSQGGGELQRSQGHPLGEIPGAQQASRQLPTTQ